MNVAKLRGAYERGELPRDEFWLRAQEEYRRTREHSSLPSNGAVKGIRRVDDDLIVELRDGIRMRWDIEDMRTAPNMLLNHGEYESRELQVLLDAARQAQIVFDVGANVGWYTINIARAIARRGGHLYAFEPIPRTFATLQYNVRLNALQSCTTLSNVGLGDAEQQVEFYLPKVTGSVAASQKPLFEQQENEKVTAKIVRLDEFIAQKGIKRLDLLKCDIEGAELLMLRGGMDSIARFRPVIFLELLRKWSKVYGYHPNDVIALLAKVGYQCFAIGDDELVPIASIDDETTSTNFLFTHGDPR
ncbi:MAG TPA: FkbM family methyltransferase [Gemmatimonadaceae bacterium]|nr:FkbM family methyltransferase [Gemmatimonadaceae bacterium]